MNKIKNSIRVLFLLSAITTTSILSTAHAADAPLAVGDIIFHKSKSQQSAALKEATGSNWTHVGILVQDKSKWYVAEAIGPVKATPLADFIARGRNKEYKIMRFKYFNPKTMTTKLYSTIKKYNKPYDIYFEFTNSRIYCSELTYKVMREVTGQELGKVQKMKEMNLDGPYVQMLIKKRLTDTGRELNPNEPIITPISQLIDTDLTLVRSR